MFRKGLGQVKDRNLGDHARPKLVGSVGVDAKSVVSLSMHERHLMDKGKLGMSKGVGLSVGPADLVEDDASNGRNFATAGFDVNRLHKH